MNIRKLTSSIPFLLIVVLFTLTAIATLSLDKISIDEHGLDGLASSSTIVWLLVSLSLASGICAMAVVQCWKVFLRPRAYFHANVLKKTFGDQYITLMRLSAPGFGPPEEYPPIFSQLLYLRFDGRLEFLDSPAEVVMSQLADAAEYALMNRDENEEYYRLSEIFVGSLPDGVGQTRAEYEKLERGTDRDRYFLDKNLQLLHVQLHEMWRFRVRAVSVFVSAALASTICSMLNTDYIIVILGTAAAGMFGGVFSWLTRDVISVVEANRR